MTTPAPCCRCNRYADQPGADPAADRDEQRNRELPVPADSDRHLFGEVRAARIQDRRPRGHRRHHRLHGPGQSAARDLDRPGNGDGQRREPDRRHQGHRGEDDVRPRVAAEHPVGARPVGHAPARPQHLDGPHERRRQPVGSAVGLHQPRQQQRQQQVVARRRRHHRHVGDRRLTDLLRLRHDAGDAGHDRRRRRVAADRRRRHQLRDAQRHQSLQGQRPRLQHERQRSKRTTSPTRFAPRARARAPRSRTSTTSASKSAARS